MASKVFAELDVAGGPKPENGHRGYWNIDSLLDHRGAEGSREYLVRWEGYGQEHDSWTPEANFLDHKCIEDYWAKRANSSKQAK